MAIPQQPPQQQPGNGAAGSNATAGAIDNGLVNAHIDDLTSGAASREGEPATQYQSPQQQRVT